MIYDIFEIRIPLSKEINVTNVTPIGANNGTYMTLIDANDVANNIDIHKKILEKIKNDPDVTQVMLADSYLCQHQ